MPARTAKGSAALSQVLGFRRYIETAEADRMQFAEQENVWATYLPYAIVFGATKDDGGQGVRGPGCRTTSRCVVVVHLALPVLSRRRLRIDGQLPHSTSGAIVSTPSSSGGSGFSGGFSGGGGGGGGGGSW